ncbi:chemotaxis protein CheW [Salinirubrum litoreum]|uniref:Chemotaxis protein CheW n=1 Tax=Salinirubrum litoreum TaxID=1126234 RepID=A0ABD5R8K6_9EURY|nr:chemotaxis protein CheW [Salinirubrum litoreum]
MEQVVVFRLGTETYAVDVDAVRSIVEDREPTRVPRAPEGVVGVIDLRGEITAVVDPTVSLDSDLAQVTPDGGDLTGSQVLVLDREDGVGLRVDEVLDVLDVPPERVETEAAMDELAGAGVSHGLVKKVIKLETAGDLEPVAWLDVETLVELSAA